MKNFLLFFIIFYQKFISIILPGKCRYYPTCSEYCVQQIRHNTITKALFFSIVRILKCNQLFKGGIDYPVVKRDFKNLVFESKKINIKYWFIRKKQNTFYVLRKTDK